MKAIAQYMPLVLFLTLYKVVLTFENVDKILKNYELYISPYIPVVLGGFCLGM